MSKIIYAEDKDLQLWVELIDECLFVHVNLRRFGKDVLDKLKVAWDHLRVASYFDGWEAIYTYTKDPRIVNIIGGAEELADPKLKKVGVRMFKWDLK